MHCLCTKQDIIPHILLAHNFSSYDYFIDRVMDSLEIMLVTKGNWRVVIDNEEYLQKPGDLMILPPGIRHKVFVTEKGKLHIHYALHYNKIGDYKLISNESILKREGNLYLKHSNTFFSQSPRFYLPYFMSLKTESPIFSLFRDLIEHWSSDDIYGKYKANIMLLNMLCQISLEFLEELFNKNRTHSEKKETVSKVMQFIEQNFSTIQTLEDIARPFNLNPSYLGNVFHRGVGMTPIYYLNYFKILKAKEFIKETDWSFKKIGIEIGIPNAYYFSNLFKKYEGVTMSEYKSLLDKSHTSS